jgi:ketosteroid isomerase-like protein
MTTIPADLATTLFAAADANDLDRYTALLAPDVHFRFGNAEAITGRDNVRDAVAQFFTTIKNIKHTIINEWHQDATIVLQQDVTYTRLDDQTVTIPAVNILRVNDGIVTDYLIYVDLTPVYA